MSLKPIHTDKAPAAIGPYSQAIIADEFIFCSGQIALDPASGAFVDEAVSDQTRRVLTNLKAVLEATGSSLDQVIKTTIYLIDMNDFATVNKIYAEFFGQHEPARTTVAVVALPKNARIEIEAVAKAN